MRLTKLSFTVLSTLLGTVWTPFSSNLSGSFTRSRTLAQNYNVDQLTNHKDEVRLNSPTLRQSVVKDGLSFNGVDNYIEISNVPALNFGTGDFSISAWIKTNDKLGINVILDKRVEISGPVQGYVLSNYNGNLLFQLADGSGWTNYDSNVFIADGQWHHVVVTVDRDDPNGGRWYVDGQEVGKPFNPTGRQGSLNNSKPLRIGRHSDHPTWPGFFKGNLDKVKLFKRKLSVTEINAIYQANSMGTQSNVVAVWKLDATSTTTAADSTGTVARVLSTEGLAAIATQTRSPSNFAAPFSAPQVFAQYPNVQPPANEAKQDYFSIPEVEKIYTTPEIERIYYPSSKGIVDINRGSISVWLNFTPNPNLRDHLVFATDDSRISLHVDTFFHTGKGRDILRIGARAGGNRQNPQAPQRGFPEASIIIDNDWQLQDLCTNKPTICPLAAFPENEWHLVGMTWEGYPEGVVRIYLDGRLMGEGRYDSTNDDARPLFKSFAVGFRPLEWSGEIQRVVKDELPELDPNPKKPLEGGNRFLSEPPIYHIPLFESCCTIPSQWLKEIPTAPTEELVELRPISDMSVERGGIILQDLRIYQKVLTSGDFVQIAAQTPFPTNSQQKPSLPGTVPQSLSASKAEAERLLQQGNQQFQSSQFDAALLSFQQALTIYQQIGVRAVESRNLGQTLYNIGLVYYNLGQYPQALKYYKQTLTVYQRVSEGVEKGKTLNGMGLVYNKIGQYSQAITYLKLALNLYREEGYARGEGATVYNLGLVYYNLGQYDLANQLFKQAKAVYQQVGEGAGEMKSLTGIGLVYNNQGNYPKALESYKGALTIAKKLGDLGWAGIIFNNLGTLYSSQGKVQKALEFYQLASSIRGQVGDRAGQAATLNNIGLIYHKLGQYSQALLFYYQALKIIEEISDLPGRGKTLNNIGLTLLQTGNFAEATRTLYSAIKVWESLRPELTDADKVSLFETQAFTYRLLQIAFIAQNQTSAALEIAERGRARAVVELLAKRLSSNPKAISDIAPPSIEQIQQISQEQNATLVEYSIVSEQDLFIWVIQPKGKITFRLVDLKSLKPLLQDLVLDTRQSIGVRSRDLTQEISLTPSDLVKLKDDAPGWEPWEIVTVDTGSGILKLRQSSFPEGVTIERPLSDVAAKVESRRTTNSHLQQLHQLLIEPIAEFLPTDPEARVIFIPQGELFLVPFPALQDAEEKYLIEKHTILTAPAIQVLDLTRKQRFRVPGFAKNMLVVGNPTMPKVSLIPENPPQPLAALPNAEQEAKAIAHLFQTKAFTGNQATKAAIVQQLSNARLIHFATHGLLDDIRGLGSAIALAPSDTDNGLLTAEEILELNLNAELVVLSACNTGQGRITGDGVIGLSRSLIAAGTPSVIVSLWAVPDAPTASLMTEFYQNFQRTGDKAQALRQAMLTTMQQHPNPRDWAAFTLIGEAE